MRKSVAFLVAVFFSTLVWFPVAHAAKMEEVPPFTLTTLSNSEISLESLRGKVVMINFWATYCPPCVEELPTMQALKKSLSDEPFEILAINMGEDAQMIRAFFDRLGFNFDFPILLDTDSSVAVDYDVLGLPSTLLVDKQGNFAFGGVGARDWNGKEARAQIMPLLDDSP